MYPLSRSLMCFSSGGGIILSQITQCMVFPVGLHGYRATRLAQEQWLTTLRWVVEVGVPRTAFYNAGRELVTAKWGVTVSIRNGSLIQLTR